MTSTTKSVLYSSRKDGTISIWYALNPNGVQIKPSDFARYRIKINNVIYEAWDNDFEKALFWARMSR